MLFRSVVLGFERDSAVTNVVISSAARTAIGSYGKSLKGVPPTDLGATATTAAIERAGLATDQIDHAVFGNVIHTEPADTYIARVAGLFDDEIVPVQVRVRKDVVDFNRDEHIREDASLEAMAKLPTVFKKEGGTVTAGNASGMNDAGAAVVLMSEEKAAELGAP